MGEEVNKQWVKDLSSHTVKGRRHVFLHPPVLFWCWDLPLGSSVYYVCATWNPLNATTPTSLMGSSLPISPCPAQFAYDNHIEKSQMDWFAPRWLLISLLHLTFMCQVIKRKEHRTGVKGIVCNPRPGSLTSYSVLLSHRMSWSSCLPRVSGMLSRI